jgi:tol-pal system protein YbgF
MRAAFLVVLSTGLLFRAPAWAQNDTSGLVDRLDRLERELNTLQSQVYRGQGGATTVITSPALGGGATAGTGGGGAISGDTYSILDQRINALESQLQDLTSQVEKANYDTNQLSAKVERMRADDEQHFKDIEAKLGSATPASEGPARTGNADVVAPGAPPSSLQHPLNHPSGATAAVTPPPPPAKSAQEQYDAAFTLLRNSDYDGATKAFRAFLARYPQDALAGNAMYWLGQIPYSQGNYDQAAVTFMDAYRKYPKSAKAGESLLKVGLSMSNLGKKKDACVAIQRFSTEFPDAADNLKRQATTERHKLGC